MMNLLIHILLVIVASLLNYSIEGSSLYCWSLDHWKRISSP